MLEIDKSTYLYSGNLENVVVYFGGNGSNDAIMSVLNKWLLLGKFLIQFLHHYWDGLYVSHMFPKFLSIVVELIMAACKWHVDFYALLSWFVNRVSHKVLVDLKLKTGE